MKLIIAALVCIMAASIVGAGCSRASHHLYTTIPDAEAVAQLKHFVSDKQAQFVAVTNGAAPEYSQFFAAARAGDWPAVSNAFIACLNSKRRTEQSANADDRDLARGTRWATILEIDGAMEAFGVGSPKYAAAFGRDIVNSIPPGSIYFGGTDPGRFVVTAMCRSQVAGDPFFVLTQNGLADRAYLDYLRQMYGEKIYVPTHDDWQHCSDEYAATVKKPGGPKYPSGYMAVNGLLAKLIVDKNPGHEFYLEESFPLDWMYPHLEPHNLIFKVNPQPLSSLSDDVVRADHEYWTRYTQPMIGGWLKDETSIKEIAAYAEKTFGRRDFAGFTGDREFIEDAYAHRSFSKLRSAIAGVYAWRAQHATGADQERMAREADFAFRQAWALCPDSLEVIYRYVNFLVEQKRADDALLVAQSTADLPSMRGSNGGQLHALVQSLKTYQIKR